jgi:hypothetical protein
MASREGGFSSGYALMVQRWARANEEPIIAGVNWHDWRAEFLDLVA